MKFFQIITSDGEFDGKFEVKFSDMDDSEEKISDVEDFEEDILVSEDFRDEIPVIEKVNILYCCGEKWCDENPTSIDDKLIESDLISNYDKVYWTIKHDDYLIKINDYEIEKTRIYIRKEDREIYDSIKQSEGDLNGCSNMELFLIAMMLGYNKKGKHGLKGINSTANDGFVRIGSFPDDAWYIIKSIAVYEEEYMEVLLSNNKMFDIAEKYAIYGIKELEKMYFENEHNFLKRMEKLLTEEFDIQDIASDIVDDIEIE